MPDNINVANLSTNSSEMIKDLQKAEQALSHLKDVTVKSFADINRASVPETSKLASTYKQLGETLGSNLKTAFRSSVGKLSDEVGLSGLTDQIFKIIDGIKEARAEAAKTSQEARSSLQSPFTTVLNQPQAQAQQTSQIAKQIETRFTRDIASSTDRMRTFFSQRISNFSKKIFSDYAEAQDRVATLINQRDVANEVLRDPSSSESAKTKARKSKSSANQQLGKARDRLDRVNVADGLTPSDYQNFAEQQRAKLLNPLDVIDTKQKSVVNSVNQLRNAANAGDVESAKQLYDKAIAQQKELTDAAKKYENTIQGERTKRDELRKQARQSQTLFERANTEAEKARGPDTVDKSAADALTKAQKELDDYKAANYGKNNQPKGPTAGRAAIKAEGERLKAELEQAKALAASSPTTIPGTVPQLQADNLERARLENQKAQQDFDKQRKLVNNTLRGVGRPDLKKVNSALGDIDGLLALAERNAPAAQPPTPPKGAESISPVASIASSLVLNAVLGITFSTLGKIYDAIINNSKAFALQASEAEKVSKRLGVGLKDVLSSDLSEGVLKHAADQGNLFKGLEAARNQAGEGTTAGGGPAEVFERTKTFLSLLLARAPQRNSLSASGIGQTASDAFGDTYAEQELRKLKKRELTGNLDNATVALRGSLAVSDAKLVNPETAQFQGQLEVLRKKFAEIGERGFFDKVAETLTNLNKEITVTERIAALRQSMISPVEQYRKQIEAVAETENRLTANAHKLKELRGERSANSITSKEYERQRDNLLLEKENLNRTLSRANQVLPQQLLAGQGLSLEQLPQQYKEKLALFNVAQRSGTSGQFDLNSIQSDLLSNFGVAANPLDVFNRKMEVLNKLFKDKSNQIGVEQYGEAVKNLKEQLAGAVGIDLKPLNSFFEKTETIEKLRNQGVLSPAQGDLANLKNRNQFLQGQGVELSPLEQYKQRLAELANMRAELESKDPDAYQRLVGSATKQFLTASGEGGPVKLASAATFGSSEAASAIINARAGDLNVNNPAAQIANAVKAQEKIQADQLKVQMMMLDALRNAPQGINLEPV